MQSCGLARIRCVCLFWLTDKLIGHAQVRRSHLRRHRKQPLSLADGSDAGRWTRQKTGANMGQHIVEFPALPMHYSHTYWPQRIPMAYANAAAVLKKMKDIDRMAYETSVLMAAKPVPRHVRQQAPASMQTP